MGFEPTTYSSRRRGNRASPPRVSLYFNHLARPVTYQRQRAPMGFCTTSDTPFFQVATDARFSCSGPKQRRPPFAASLSNFLSDVTNTNESSDSSAAR
jgi:hypothetical protein